MKNISPAKERQDLVIFLELYQTPPCKFLPPYPAPFCKEKCLIETFPYKPRSISDLRTFLYVLNASGIQNFEDIDPFEAYSGWRKMLA